MKINKVFAIGMTALALAFTGCGKDSSKEEVKEEVKNEATEEGKEEPKKEGKEEANSEAQEAKFDLSAGVYDYGIRVDKIIIESPVEVDGNSLDAETFTVTTNNESNAESEYENGDRTVEDVYITDEDGNKVEAGKFINIDLETKVNTKYADLLQWSDEKFSNVPLTMSYNLIQNKDIESVDGKKVALDLMQDELIQREVDEFTEGESAKGIHYRDYKPEKDGEKHPLVIWLHGAGEGGDNNVTQISANRGGVAFISNEAKEAFDNPYVLAPQSPDFWIPGDENSEGAKKNGTDNTDKLVALIKEYIAENEDIDEDRVYIGGCSMGGYQTWKTVIAAPELFAAAFPICAAYDVPVEEMEKVKDIPMWLVHCEIDDAVPVENSRKAYKGMMDLGADIQYTEYPDVKVDGEDFNPHASWIYALNNDPETEDGVSFFDWLASKTR